MIVDMWLLLSIDSQSVEETRDIFPSYCGNMVIGVGGEVNPPSNSFPDFPRRKIY